MPTLILPPRYSGDSIKLWRAAITEGWEVERLAGWRVPEGWAPADPVLYGEPLFNAAVAEQLQLELIEPADDFLCTLPAEYVHRQVRLMTAEEARSSPGPVFLKPPNRKTFPAGVYASGAELPAMPDDDPVLASAPVSWLAEFRFFILDWSIRAWSSYWLRGELARHGDDWIVEPGFEGPTRRLVERLLADTSIALPRSIVIDAGVIDGIGPAVVEANEASGSGIYGCRPEYVLDVLRVATVRAGPEP